MATCVYSSAGETTDADRRKRPFWAEDHCSSLGLELYNPEVPYDDFVQEVMSDVIATGMMDELFVWTDARMARRGRCYRFNDNSWVEDENGDRVCGPRSQQCLKYDLINSVYEPEGCHNPRHYFICV